MVPLPRRQNPQRQPLTVSLRKICRDYPAGAGVLRELLQNADDAGASTVKFVLDTSTHPDSPVLVEGLSQYQGPALLAYNDALFSEKDFRSLTSLGDSKKVHDYATTGKFGLGFSSVYNWTDCPSIVSGSTLLFLDPHHSWSRVFDPPGGPDYDFTASAKEEAMANQLHCFSLINSGWECPFDGTIIRIPLRDASQAKRSEISSKEASIYDVRYSMDSFAGEMGSNGLLFLKSVHRIVLSVDDQRLDEIEILNRHDLIRPKERLKNVIDCVTNHGDLTGGEAYHEVHLRHWAAKRETQKTFGVLNSVAGSAPDASLMRWAASEKLFPWVAVAAQITDHDRSSESGRLYSVLPLPILTGLPVHIHGLFSISADRSRLHGHDGRGVRDNRPEAWNKFLFSRMIPGAWAKLIVNICQNHQAQDLFHLWPTTTAEVHQWWYGMSRSVIDVISRNNDPVWFTEFGYVSIRDGLLASAASDVQQRRACREAELRVIYLPDQLFEEARQTPASRSLCPETLYKGLRENRISERLSSQSKLVVLEYLQHQIPLTDLAALEIFPFEDGRFRSLTSPPTFLHRDALDKRLFARQPGSCIDTDRLSEVTSAWLHERGKDNSIVRYRSPADICDYFSSHVANGSSDTIVFGKEERSMLSDIWEWIMRHYQGDPSLSAFGSLFLVPLYDSGVRKLIPVDVSNTATCFDTGKGKELALKIVAIDPSIAPKLVADDALTDVTLRHLLSFSEKDRSLHLKDGKKFGDFLHFLVEGRILLQNADEDIKDLVFRTVKELYLAQRGIDLGVDIDMLKPLCIFKEIQWPIDMAGSATMIRTSTDLTRNVAFVGLRKLVPLPCSSNRVFLDATDEWARALFEDLDLVKCLDEIKILEELVIPAIQDGSYEHMASNLRLDVTELLLQNYFRLSASAKGCISNLPVVPLEKRDGDERVSFACPVDIVDPHEPALVSLYFEDEMARPEGHFYHRFSGVLASCGVIKRLNERLVLNRIETYARKQLPFGVVAVRAEKLLQLPLCKDISRADDFAQSVRRCAWLPGRSPEGSCSLTDSLGCRDSNDRPFVGRVWYTLPFHVESSWRSMLGWQDPIQIDVLISQLARSIAESDVHSVEHTLFYLDRHYMVEDYVGRLSKLNFIRSSNGLFIGPARASREAAERLMPYLYNVDLRFWDEHTKILRHAKVPEMPDLGRLHDVQGALESKAPLDEADLDVAVEVAHIWSSQSYKSFENLKVPDETGLLADIDSLVFNDAPWLSDVKCALAHPKLSRAIADRLGMQPVSELWMNNKFGISDLDEDEFNQREEVADGIRDTLDRYTRESTFHEYLANADDCGSASTVNFLFDDTNHNKERLLATDLDSLQGPALLVHNDGVFTESDFEGLKRVGRGSKRDDPTTIGKFGRGSQTMYHWTDVPMILSGHHLLILDPLRQHLPFNYRTRQKKPGVKVKYTKLKSTCQDQLAPFEGLWGFNSDNDFYDGTIFRFPLRGKGTGSELLESLRCPDSMTTVEMFRNFLDEARLTLLFLRNITSIDFRTRHDANSEWRVSRGNWPETGTFSDWAYVIVERCNFQDNVIRRTERWWRVMEDVDDAPVDLQYRHKRTMKYVECGIAAQVPTDGEATGPLTCLKSRFFNCVPLKFESTLPVQVHATFLLSGDRQNIATEATSQDAGSDWNRWLLEKKIPQVYLQFLEDLGRKIGYTVYDYFPIETKQRQQSLSDLVRTAFWEEFKSSHHRLFPVVEPVQIEDARENSAVRAKRRQAPRMAEAKQAVFDFLDKQKSDAFRPLLSNCSKNLVCPPTRLNKHVRNLPQFDFVTPSLVRRVLRSEKAGQYVRRLIQTDSNSLSILLSFIIPETDGDFAELDGSKILPLLDRNLGTLSLRTGNTQGTGNHTFFSASAKLRRLFLFASPYFIEEKGNEEFVKRVLDSGRFNIERFKKSHVHLILDCKKTWAADTASKGWLFDFWEYMNSTSQAAEHPIEAETLDWKRLQRFPLLLFHQGCKETLTSLDYFQNNPVVLSSGVDEYEDLYMDFPELGIVDSRTIPRSYSADDKSLSSLDSINRFLKSIQILATRSAQGFTEFIGSKLKKKNIEILRAIIMNLTPQVAPSLSDTANDLPVWRRISSENGYLTAREALIAQDSAFVVPWMKDYHRFTKDKKSFRIPTIDSVRLLKNYILPNLPQRVDETTKDSYLRLVNAIPYNPSLKQKIDKKKNTRYFIVPLVGYRLAAGQDGKLCLASAFYDHSDTVFAAAFRSEASNKFLIPEVRHHLSFWHEVGLRCRENGRFKGPDYLACLHALQCRLTGPPDPHLAADTQVVLYPLSANDSSLNDLSPHTWSAIAKLDVFPVISVREYEPEYRRARTETLALQQNTLSLENIVRLKFAAVCWTQTAFVLHEPSSFSIQKSGSKGQPSCAVVWEHLRFLAETAQSIVGAEIENFLSDLQKTYKYLHLNQHESKNSFSDTNAAIWLNADVIDSNLIGLDVLHSSWTSLENLILDSPCDAPPLMMVNPFLGRFSSLLRDIGCKSLHYPSIALPSCNRSETAFAAIRQLREKEILNDVRFEAEGSVISAHKVILASRSLYCEKQFHGPWAFESESNSKSKTVKLEDMTYATLQILIEYCYNDQIDWAAGMHVQEGDDSPQIAEKLDALLDVLVAADRWLMPDLHLDAHRQVIGGIRFFVRPDNVKQVETVADEANAEELRNYCEEYSMENAEAVLLANVEDGMSVVNDDA